MVDRLPNRLPTPSHSRRCGLPTIVTLAQLWMRHRATVIAENVPRDNGLPRCSRAPGETFPHWDQASGRNSRFHSRRNITIIPPRAPRWIRHLCLLFLRNCFRPSALCSSQRRTCDPPQSDVITLIAELSLCPSIAPPASDISHIRFPLQDVAAELSHSRAGPACCDRL